MLTAPLPLDEEERIRALRTLDLLDTEFEPAYDSIVQLASIICQTPIVSINLVDTDRQWSKASVGGVDLSAPRDASFCAHTILHEETLVVEDTHEDERFHDNPLVSGIPHIRFYAGQRLVTPSGHAIGALCVVDRQPRQLSDDQLSALRALGRQTAMLFELRIRSRQLEEEVGERRRAEAESQAARALADAASQAKSDFLSSMSHELRTPLNSVIGFSRALQRNRTGNLHGSDLKYLSRIEANGVHLLNVINDVLDIAKVEAGRLTADIAVVDLGTLIRETVHELEGRVLDEQGSAVQLIADVPAGLVPVATDPMRLKQMIINLVGNALKFTERGHVLVRIIAGDDGQPLRIDVEDTGIGIPLDRQQAVFEAFEQAADDTSEKYGGTGLGLAITKGFAELLGYRISVESAPGQGSTFSIHLR
ncbi:GAF domain-containing sensor histidine kinase [soil metagenome]